jgi:predicted transcriptional regulator
MTPEELKAFLKEHSMGVYTFSRFTRSLTTATIYNFLKGYPVRKNTLDELLQAMKEVRGGFSQ